MGTISEEVKTLAASKRNEIGSFTYSSHGIITFDFSGWAVTTEILLRLKNDEISNEQAIAELKALDPVKIKADADNRHKARQDEEAKLRTRTEKGNSLIEFTDTYVVLDFETTGLDPLYDRIIEVGALRVENGRIVNQFNTLVNPGFEISAFITDLTGITNEMLSTAPMLVDVLPSLIDFIGSTVILGHNVNFDINFLYTACEQLLKQPFTNDFIDTMRLSRRIFKQ